MLKLSVLCLSLIVAAGAATAADQRYSTWSNAGDARNAPGDAALQEMIDRLNALIDKADKARAADPNFLRDLRDVVRGYDRPWRKHLLSDDFGDGDFTRNPEWTVSAGRYDIERGWGLRSFVEAPAPAQAGSESRGAAKDGDLAVALLRGILTQATRQKSASQQAAPAPTDTSAQIHTPLAISNAFSITVEFSAWKAPGRIEFGPFQGASREAGYRLVYRSGEPLLLTRVSGRGSSIVDASGALLNLEDKKNHTLVWERTADGAMKVSLDGAQVLTSFDRGFRDSFQGFSMVNRQGDFIVRRVDIWGTE